MLTGSAFGSFGSAAVMNENTRYMNRISAATTQIDAAATWRTGAASSQFDAQRLRPDPDDEQHDGDELGQQVDPAARLLAPASRAIEMMSPPRNSARTWTTPGPGQVARPEDPPLDDAERHEHEVAERHRRGMRADRVARQDDHARSERDLEQHAEDRAIPERRQAERHREPGKGTLARQVLRQSQTSSQPMTTSSSGPADRPEREVAGVEREDIDGHADRQGEDEPPVRGPEQQRRRRDDGQRQPADRARVDVGEDLVAVELDGVRAVEDADHDVHHEHGDRDEVQIARGAHPVGHASRRHGSHSHPPSKLTVAAG